jgi:carboxymethylenebutenolidase
MIRSEAVGVEDGAVPVTVAVGVGRGAAVVIAPSAFGVMPDLQRQMEEIAGVASEVLSFDPFWRGDAGPADYRDMPRIVARLQSLDRARSAADLRAVIARARGDNPARKVVVVGICFGGPFALHAAADGVADGVVMWHPSRLEQHLARIPEAGVPMALHFGELDPFVPMSTVAAVRAAVADRVDVDVVVHAGATHGFSHPEAPAYDPRAERAAVAAVVAMAKKLAS